MRSASRKPRVVTSSVRSPLRSSSALVATVVPIFTQSTCCGVIGAPAGSCSSRRMPSTAASAIGLGVVAQQLQRVQRAVGRAADDVGEGAAAVDPELPARRSIGFITAILAGPAARCAYPDSQPRGLAREWAACATAPESHPDERPPAPARPGRDPCPRRRDGADPPPDPCQPGDGLPGARHLATGGRAAAALGLRGAPRPGRHRRGGHAARGQFRPAHRPARRHGRAAHRRDQRQALGQQGAGHHARLRPRRPHGDAAVGGAAPGGDAQLRRPPAPGVPAGRRRRGRRAAHAGGRLPRPVPLRGDVRHAQRARQAGRASSWWCRASRWPAATPA